ncbi:MFS family permease [Bradyrhizobium sp. USDA 4502]
MSITFSPSGVGSVGVQNPELATSFRRAQWRMLFAAMFCYLFFYTGRQTFGFAIPGIQAEFGVTKEALGWASAALLWCYAVGQAINGNLGDKFGGRRVMSAGAILSFIMNWATSLSTGIVSLTAFWGINGYFQSMGWAPGSRLLSNWWGRHERGTVYGLYTFAAGLASVLSFVTSLVVVGYFQLDWRWIFRIPVVLLLLGGIAFYLIAREKPEDMGFASPHDEADDVTSAETAVSANEGSLARYKAVLSNWRLLVAGVAIGFQNAARYGLLVWVPVHFLGGNWAKAGAASVIDPRWISIALPVGMRVQQWLGLGQGVRLAPLPRHRALHGARRGHLAVHVRDPDLGHRSRDDRAVPVRVLHLRPAILVLGAMPGSGRPQAGRDRDRGDELLRLSVRRSRRADDRPLHGQA